MILSFTESIMRVKRVLFEGNKKCLSFSEPNKKVLGVLNNGITEFDTNLRDSKWFTQFRYGCLFFSMMNGNYLSPVYKKFFVPNMDFSHDTAKGLTADQLIKGVVYEYKAILLWIIRSGNNVIPYHLKTISRKIREMLRADSLDKMCTIAYEIGSIYLNNEERFGVKKSDGKEKDFAFAEWSFGGYNVDVLEDTTTPKFLDRKIKFLECCPRYTLFCDKYNHWTTFLGCKLNYMYFYDPKLHDRLRKIKTNYVASTVISVLINKGGKNGKTN